MTVKELDIAVVERRRKTKMTPRAIAVALIAALNLIACGEPAGGPGPDAATSPSPTQPAQTAPPPTSPPEPTPTPAPTPFGFGDGTHQVGTAVPAGTYRLREAASTCYWARLSGFGGTFGEILANRNTFNARDVVTILETDKGFQTRGCGRWSVDLSAVTTGTSAPFGDGVYIVGVDIAPGTWGAPAGERYYWERLAGFTGGFGDIVANENARGSTVVTIAATDKGFRTAGCGTWTPVR